ncbi:MAG: hypothetical protein WC217_00555 [Candidatus Paceibacterota bacterium]|jgi:hypothetical protein
MKYLKYSLIGLGALALIAIVIVAAYAVSYLRTQSTAINLQNEAAARQATLTAPSISLEGVSCDIPADAKTQYYSIVIRTSNANIATKQQQIASIIQTLGGTISNTNQYKATDRDAGYSLYADTNASLPLAQAGNFISQLKNSVTSPDYTENESNFIQDAATARQNCQSSLDQLKNVASTEQLYLSQLTSDQAAGSSLTPISDKSNLITQKLMEVRQNASGYKSGITSIMSSLNKAQVTVTIKEIPG